MCVDKNNQEHVEKNDWYIQNIGELHVFSTHFAGNVFSIQNILLGQHKIQSTKGLDNSIYTI